MDSDIEAVKRLYDCFNRRDMDGVLGFLADDVLWANGMDGGHVHGRDAVRAYWTRQWAMVSPKVEPVTLRRAADDVVFAEVRQTVRDLDGNPLQDQTHGLVDKMVGHRFRMRDGRVTGFDIESIP